MNLDNLRKDIQWAINRNSAENGSDTPDFILADYLMDCLEAYNKAVTARSAHPIPQIFVVREPT